MEQISKPYDKPMVAWLFTGCFLVFAMVVVGGITRLTGSGLSITEWNVIMGTIPPLNETDWQTAFEKYQATPQYQQENYHFNLSDFKSIFWWEFIHRFIGRLTGLVFIIPFLWFLYLKRIDKKLLKRLLFIFGLGGLQGFIGWYMVKSGLVDNPRVSHYRLATHLVTAFTTFGFIFWTALDIIDPSKKIYEASIHKIKRISLFLFMLVIVQIIYGAFVAGLKAGHVYNTFPKMGDEWIASSVGMAYENNGVSSFFDNLASIQFVHRYIAWIIVVSYCVLLLVVRRRVPENKMSRQQAGSLWITGIAIIFQFLLGVFTLLYNVPLVLGVLHQTGAFALFTALLFQLHQFRAAEAEA